MDIDRSVDDYLASIEALLMRLLEIFEAKAEQERGASQARCEDIERDIAAMERYGPRP